MNNQIKAILFDLDGTLLGVNMHDGFLPHYFKALSAHVAHLIAPDQFMGYLLQGSAAMQANQGPKTNQAVFTETFYPLTGYPREELEPVFDQFYADVFPTLGQYTRRVHRARQVVQLALDLGYDVALATNPVFPATAVQQRMAWAGVDGLPYKLVTTFENSHAAKPNLRYFQEVCDKLGYPPTACLMVGDEEIDMVAANLGCATFWVPGTYTEPPPAAPQPTYQGALADLEQLLRA